MTCRRGNTTLRWVRVTKLGPINLSFRIIPSRRRRNMPSQPSRKCSKVGRCPTIVGEPHALHGNLHRKLIQMPPPRRRGEVSHPIPRPRHDTIPERPSDTCRTTHGSPFGRLCLERNNLYVVRKTAGSRGVVVVRWGTERGSNYCPRIIYTRCDANGESQNLGTQCCRTSTVTNTVPETCVITR